MLDTSLQTEALIIDGEMQSLYVYFREESIKEALRFNLEGVGRALVYVGVDGFPVAFQFVDPMPMPSKQELDGGDIPSADQAKTILFGMANKMVAYVESSRQRLGDVLLRDAVRTAKQLAPLVAS